MAAAQPAAALAERHPRPFGRGALVPVALAAVRARPRVGAPPPCPARPQGAPLGARLGRVGPSSGQSDRRAGEREVGRRCGSSREARQAVGRALDRQRLSDPLYSRMNISAEWGELIRNPGARDHVVHVYQDAAFLLDAIVEFIGTGLSLGEAGLVVARPARCEAIVAALAAKGFRPNGALRVLDAEQVLDALMVDGTPQWTAFDALC